MLFRLVCALALTLAAAPVAAQHALTGYVRHPANQAPIAGVVVELRSEFNTAAPPATSYTDPEGRYEIEVPEGRWRLRARYEGDAVTRTLLTPPFEAGEAEGFDFYPDLEHELSFWQHMRALRRLERPSGAAEDAYRLVVLAQNLDGGGPTVGEPFSIYRLSEDPDGDTRTLAASGVTDGAGRFVADRLAPGRYRVVRNSARLGFGDLVTLVTDTETLFEIGDRMTVEDFLAAANQRFALGYVTNRRGEMLRDALVHGGRRRSATLELTLSGGGASAGTLVALEGTALRGETDATGHITFPDLPPGEYVLLVVAPTVQQRIPGIIVTPGSNDLSITL